MANRKETDVDQFIKNAQSTPAKAERAKQRYGELRGRRDQELELWNVWHDNGRQEHHLEPLLKSIDPMITAEAKKRLAGLGGSISGIALKNQLRNHAVKAIETYAPHRGSLTNHIHTNFQRVSDFEAKNRNAMYMPKEYVGKFQELRNAQNEFAEEHGREPSFDELHGRLPGWKPVTLRRMLKGFRREAYTDMGTELEHDHAVEDPISRIRGAFQLMESTLTEQQRQFAELHYPEEGLKQKSVEQIAAVLKIPTHKAYRIKKQIEAKLSPVIKGR